MPLHFRHKSFQSPQVLDSLCVCVCLTSDTIVKDLHFFKKLKKKVLRVFNFTVSILEQTGYTVKLIYVHMILSSTVHFVEIFKFEV